MRSAALSLGIHLKNTRTYDVKAQRDISRANDSYNPVLLSE